MLEFVDDLHIDPSTRGVDDIRHEVVAVASSSSVDKAKKFIADFNCPLTTKAYGSYADLAANPEVDIIYVATPHSHHYQNVRQCLEAGKPVLCEKAFTVNEAQARKLYDLAKSKNLFLMEAVWTRYFPLSAKVRELIAAGAIGPVYRATADLSLRFKNQDPETALGTTHRLTNLDLAGGALLDLGIYALTWLFQTLYHTLPPEERKPPDEIKALMTPYPQTGGDESTTVILKFPAGPAGAPYAHAVATTSLRLSTDPDGAVGEAGAPSIRVFGTKGEIQVFHPAFRPTRYRLIVREGAGSGMDGGGEGMKSDVKEETLEVPGSAKGFCWEADEAARCIRDGKLESDGLSAEESCVIMGVMDEVRKQGGLKYPEKIETTDYPVQL